MATIPKSNIVTNNTILASDVKTIIDALDGTTGYEIVLGTTLTIQQVTNPEIHLINTTASTGKDWKLLSHTDGTLIIQHQGIVNALIFTPTTGAATFVSSGTFGDFLQSTVSSGYNLKLYKGSGSAILFSKTTATAQDWSINPGDNFEVYDITAGGAAKFVLAKTTGAATFASTLAIAGATVSSSTGLVCPVGTTALSSLRVPHGAAPTTPVDGDVWSTTTTLNFRLNGVTKSITMT